MLDTSSSVLVPLGGSTLGLETLLRLLAPLPATRPKASMNGLFSVIHTCAASGTSNVSALKSGRITKRWFQSAKVSTPLISGIRGAHRPL